MRAKSASRNQDNLSADNVVWLSDRRDENTEMRHHFMETGPHADGLFDWMFDNLMMAERLD